MHDAGLVDAITHLTGLGVLDRRGYVGRHCAHFRVRHQAARTEDLAQLTDDAHGIGARDDHIEIHLAFLDLLGEIFQTHDVGARSARNVLVLAAGEYRHAHGLAGAVWQHG